jgi:sigma-B regulation protein RsbU (phosphoserine phosphatase)
MKKNNPLISIGRKSTWTGFLLIVIAALTLGATSLLQNYFATKALKEEASMRVKGRMDFLESEILNVITQAETGVHNKIWITKWCLDFPDSLPNVGRLIVEDNPVLVGSTFALVPGYYRRQPLLAPYTFRSGDSLVTRSLATAAYNYPSKEWFVKPLELDEGYWSEPYVDTGGGDMLMTTYSIPIRDGNNRVAGVLTGDISLDWLGELVNGAKAYPNSQTSILSREGLFMVSPMEEVVMTKTADDLVGQMEDSLAFAALNQAMLQGLSGETEVILHNEKNQVFYAPIERTGWSMCTIIPENDIYGSLKKNTIWIRLLQLLGLAMIVLILRAVTKSQLKFAEVSQKKEKMESELKIAHGIQMAMLPNIFPPFPERSDIDMYAFLDPAKEVGGDLYDFYIRDDKLFFCIGDVSGKGVPAALVMAVTRSQFRTVSAHERSPLHIVTAMNNSMSDMNKDMMFVTFFCGILDLVNGHLRYCNAGHNGPLIIGDEVRPLPVVPNLPLGISPGFAYKEQETDLIYGEYIFLYTDGVTEAENSNQRLYGEDRLMDAMDNTGKNAQEKLNKLKENISSFVGDAHQSDDMTTMLIRYMNFNNPDTMERHLILHNDIQQIPQLAGFVESIAVDAGLDQSLAMSINLALEEAVTNVIMYAYPKGSDGLVDIEAIVRKDSVDFTIIDNGIPFDPTAAPEADVAASVEERPIGGLGIYLVKSIMDTVSYRRYEGKNILSMTKKTQK